MNQRVLQMNFGQIYALYIQKVLKKNRTKEELDTVIFWLTGHDRATLEVALNDTVKDFFENFPRLHPNANLIAGSVCGHRVQDISDPLERRVRCLDKLVDELAKGKPLDKILRKA